MMPELLSTNGKFVAALSLSIVTTLLLIALVVLAVFAAKPVIEQNRAQRQAAKEKEGNKAEEEAAKQALETAADEKAAAEQAEAMKKLKEKSAESGEATVKS